jgi:hypothetical protein
MHTDYVDIPQPFKQDNCYTINSYGLPSSPYAWFSTMRQFLQTQGSSRFFGGLAAAFFTAGFRVAFIQEPSVRDPFRQEYITWHKRICADSDTHTVPVHMFRLRSYECNQAPAVPNHSTTAHDLLNWFQADTHFCFVKPSRFWCGPAQNALPAEARDVVLAARAARDNSHDNHQNRRLVSVSNSASENDDQDGDDEETYGRIHALYTDDTTLYTDVS